METILNFNLLLSFQQVTEMVRQLPTTEKLQLANILQKEVKQSEKDFIQTHFASQNILAKDWLNLEEDKAWKHL